MCIAALTFALNKYKKHKEFQEQLEKRRKEMCCQIIFREVNTASSYKHDFKHQ